MIADVIRETTLPSVNDVGFFLDGRLVIPKESLHRVARGMADENGRPMRLWSVSGALVDFLHQEPYEDAHGNQIIGHTYRLV